MIPSSYARWILSVAAVLLMVTLIGCGEGQRKATVTTAAAAYNEGDYSNAYEQAMPLATSNRLAAADRSKAAYLAGLAAEQMEDVSTAERYLRLAAAGPDPSVAGDALAALGLIHQDLGRWDLAASELAQAALRLRGEEQAKAWYYAGANQQRIGQWVAARTSFYQARNVTKDRELQQRIAQQLEYDAYSLQAGAYSDARNAQRAAEALARRAAQTGAGEVRLTTTRTPGSAGLTFVRVGRFTTYAAAQTAKQKLGEVNAVVVAVE